MKRLACAIAVAAVAAWILFFPNSNPDRPDSATESSAPASASASRDRPRLEAAAAEPAWPDPSATSVDTALMVNARDLEAAIDDLKAGADSYYDLDDDARAEYDRLHASLAERGSLLPVATRLDVTNAQDFQGELDE